MNLSPGLLAAIILSYFFILLVIAYKTGRKADSEDFYIAGRKSPWYLVAFGMIGASLSGVTFISVPGWVGSQQMGYLQMVAGYVVGYAFIAGVLMPLYYRLQLTSIYSYLDDRMGRASYKTGSAFFLLSRIIGASFRLFLVALVIHRFITGPMGISFGLTVFLAISLIWLYTHRGGIATIVYTDTLQTASMLLAVIISIWAIGRELGWGLSDIISEVRHSPYSQIFFFEYGWKNPQYFAKQFLAGASIAIVMTGLDQDMMQKNLSIRTLGDAQKNMYVFTMVLVVVNVIFLMLGVLLYLYAAHKGIDMPTEMVQGREIERTDLLYPTIALNHLGPIVGLSFIIGLIAAAYSSADSALTALTTAFCVDLLGIERHKDLTPTRRVSIRRWVHIAMSAALMLVIYLFYLINDEAVISAIFKVAGYTYGPLLGLYMYGLFTRYTVIDRLVPIVCILSPIVTYLINRYSEQLFMGYKFGFELLLLNGLLTFLGLLFISKHNINGRS